MKALLLSLIVFSSSASFALNSIQEIQVRCPAGVQSEILHSDQFRWGYSLTELISRFTEIYSSPKRLPKKAYFDEATQSVKLPFEPARGGDVVITEKFVQTVADHIEKAFELQVIDGVFFPDMGHSHLLIPEDLYDSKYSDIPIDQMSRMYEGFYTDDQVKILYHTAEQLQMTEVDGSVINDDRVRFRHQTRNLVGGNYPKSDLEFYQNPESKVNTVHNVEGYRWWGGGFNLSANQKGCFAYKKGDQVYYFDLSLYDLEPSTDSDVWGTVRNF